MTYKWHTWLGMPKHDKTWHENDMADELAEYAEEHDLFKKWSELSDVVYTCSRGRWSGHDISFPFSTPKYYLGLVYMYPKYTSRWLFFRVAGKRTGAPQTVREVRNPRKTHKLHAIAAQNGIDPAAFQKTCERQLRYWLLLP